MIAPPPQTPNRQRKGMPIFLTITWEVGSTLLSLYKGRSQPQSGSVHAKKSCNALSKRRIQIHTSPPGESLYTTQTCSYSVSWISQSYSAPKNRAAMQNNSLKWWHSPLQRSQPAASSWVSDMATLPAGSCPSCSSSRHVLTHFITVISSHVWFNEKVPSNVCFNMPRTAQW